MKIQKGLGYAKTHEWVMFEDGDKAKIGISDFAQDSLGDLVFVNLPEVGDAIEKGKSFADVESVKAVSDVFAPVSGVVTAVNEELLDSPEKINEDAYGAWFIEIENAGENGELLDEEAYIKFCESEAH